ncbi:hypothetical protein HWV62_32343 [Athelia sp. TMB]|nr:hypothetical protein HWV62_32343 [Athelia sp. TMB]
MAPRQCVCGFSTPLDNAFSNHQRSCKKAKKQLSVIMERNSLLKREREARELDDARRKDLLEIEAKVLIAEASQPVTAALPDQLNLLPSEDVPPQTADNNVSDLNEPLATRRRRRMPKLPKRFIHPLPEAAPPLLMDPSASTQEDEVAPPSSLPLPPAARLRKILNSPRNVFGLVRRYFADKFPTADPEELVTLADLSEPVDPPPPLLNDTSGSNGPNFSPYPNKTSFDLGNYYWNGSQQKTQADFKQLIDILTDPNFTPSDLRDTNWSQINAAIGENIQVLPNEPNEGEAEWLNADAGWIKDHIDISVPFAKGSDKPGASIYPGVDLYHRKIVDVLKERISNPHTGQNFHMTPYELQWQPTPEHREVRVQGEMYTSPAFLEAHEALQNSPPEPGFVDVYPQLPDEFKDFANEHIGGKGTKSPFLAHCRREFFHAQLEILLDDEFIEAWVHGIVIMCFDGILRRFFPRIFTYSADYPEKCLIPKDRIQNLGMKLDRKQRISKRRDDDENMRRNIATARDFIYVQDLPITGVAVERLLKPQSWVPTSNAFSSRLHQLGFNFFLMLVVDMLHEFELGVWKSLFIHLLRMLAVLDIALIHELDRRFRAMPTFGRDTIRKFKANMSEMKSLAARDFEDLLQCATPAPEGLFPEPHNTKIMCLLFTCAHWHALAKLRQHHDITLDILDDVTTSLGEQFRYFAEKICPCYNTQELPREAAARERREKKTDDSTGGQSRTRQPGPKARPFQLQRVKFHFLGDYVECIRHFGTTDSYSPAIGESEHRTSKKAYLRTSRKNFELQMARIERRQANLRRISERIYGVPKQLSDVAANPIAAYTMGISENWPEVIPKFLQSNAGDPAVADFRQKLQKHLAPRMSAIILSANDGSRTLASTSPLNSLAPDHARIFFKGDKFYRHNIFGVNYTTYDVHRKKDIFNPRTSHRDVMVLANNEDKSAHPYLYARVLGIFHANVIYTGTVPVDYTTRAVEFLWVRWFEYVEDNSSGWTGSTLDRLRFPTMANEDSFSFLDPGDVLRGCHVVPCFAAGQRYPDGKGISRCARDDEDYKNYYVMSEETSHRGVLWRDVLKKFRHGNTPEPQRTDGDERDGPGEEEHEGEVSGEGEDGNEIVEEEGKDDDDDDDDWVNEMDIEEEEENGTLADSGDEEEFLAFDDLYGDADSLEHAHD